MYSMGYSLDYLQYMYYGFIRTELQCPDYGGRFPTYYMYLRLLRSSSAVRVEDLLNERRVGYGLDCRRHPALMVMMG